MYAHTRLVRNVRIPLVVGYDARHNRTAISYEWLREYADGSLHVGLTIDPSKKMVAVTRVHPTRRYPTHTVRASNARVLVADPLIDGGTPLPLPTLLARLA